MTTPATSDLLPPLADKTEVEMVGQGGNVFAVIGRTARALRRAGHADYAAEFTRRATSAGSYDEVLRLLFDYVEPL